MNTIDYESLRSSGHILFEAIVGSRAYGTQTETSDEDRKFVYIQPVNALLGLGYIPQCEVNADYVGYEIRRFLELAATTNPTILELLYSPADCVVHEHPLFEAIRSRRDEFLSRSCQHAFAGYARQQIKKATGLQKKQNWDRDRILRKSPLDFCYVIEGQETRSLGDFLSERKLVAERTGATRLQHARDVYALYYDDTEHGDRSYRGLVKLNSAGEAVSNELRLSEVPRGAIPIAVFSYNASQYAHHCKEFREYQTWLEERNVTRWVETARHRQKIDGKNMMHCTRLIKMACEIARGEGVVVRRPDAPEVLAVRRGEVSLPELVAWANTTIDKIPTLFEASNLPETVDPTKADELLVELRRAFYGLDKG